MLPLPPLPRLQAQLLLVGDMGSLNARAYGDLLAAAATGRYDAVLHVGDIAYDMQVGVCFIGGAHVGREGEASNGAESDLLITVQAWLPLAWPQLKQWDPLCRPGPPPAGPGGPAGG